MKKYRKVWVIRAFLLLIWLLMAAVLGLAYLYRPWLSLALAPVAVGVSLYVFYRYRRLHQEIYSLLRNMNNHLLTEHAQSTFDLHMPALVVSSDREILWHNEIFANNMNDGETMFGSSFTKITDLSIKELRENPGKLLTYKGRHYITYLVTALNNNLGHNMILFTEVTQMYDTQQEYHQSRPVVMVILIDSYEEIVKNARESEKTHILSEINRILEQYIGKTNGFLIRLDRNRYMAVVETRHFDLMLEDRFSLLDETKNIVTGERIPITLSIGVGIDANSLVDKERDAVQALDMALGRGGDQVAMKIEGGYKFFGGGSKGVEIRTKVKSRIVASAMVELMQNADNVLVMGHKFADLDAVGAAIGMARACQCLGKEVRVVVDESKCLASQLVEYHRSHEDGNIFVSPVEAMTMVRRGTLLFAVDTHSKHFVESTDVLKSCRDVVVIDHHRKTVDFIDNAVIFYHEPYASSASEMVTELIQYFSNDCSLHHYHAEALLAGIMLDTKNFIMKTGVRTFEAAAYLKKNGADTVKVRKMFAGSMEDYRNKTKLVSSAEVYRNCALVATDREMEDIRVVASQAADDLLGINGVDASFVIYRVGRTVNVSARSMGAMNVQVLMEQMGGGGHLTMAATQIEHSNCAQVRQRLLEVIDEYHANQNRSQS